MLEYTPRPMRICNLSTENYMHYNYFCLPLLAFLSFKLIIKYLPPILFDLYFRPLNSPTAILKAAKLEYFRDVI